MRNILTGILLLSACMSIVTLADVTFNITKTSHSFQGFGAQVWAGDLSIEPLLQDLNIRIVRMDIGNVGRKSDVETWSDTEYEAYYSSRGWRVHLETAEMLNRYNIAVILNTFSPPDHWLVHSPQTNSLSPAYYTAFSKRIAHVTKALNDKGLNILGVEPFNEPDGHWNAYVPPEAYNDIVIQLRHEMDRLKLHDIHILGPGLSHIDQGEETPWIDRLSSKAVESLGIWSTHAYQWDKDKVRLSNPASLREDFITSFKAAIVRKDPNLTKPVYITEYTPIKAFKEDKKVCESDAFAARAVEDGLSLLNSGANSILFWEAADSRWSRKFKHGLLRFDKTKRPAYPALQAVFGQWAGKGEIIVAPPQPDHGIYSAVLLNRSEKMLYVSAVNSSASNLTQRIILSGVKGLKVEAAHQFSEGQLRTAKKPRLFWRPILKIDLPAHSARTIKLRYKKIK